MDDADQGMEASTATIRDRVRGQNAVTLNHQRAIYTEKLRPSLVMSGTGPFRLHMNRPAVLFSGLLTRLFVLNRTNLPFQATQRLLVALKLSLVGFDLGAVGSKLFAVSRQLLVVEPDLVLEGLFLLLVRS